jgi:hypothetical protein
MVSLGPNLALYRGDGVGLTDALLGGGDGGLFYWPLVNVAPTGNPSSGALMSYDGALKLRKSTGRIVDITDRHIRQVDAMGGTVNDQATTTNGIDDDVIHCLSDVTFTGFASGREGRVITLISYDDSLVTIQGESGAGASTDINRVNVRGDSDAAMTFRNGAMSLTYDSAQNRWVPHDTHRSQREITILVGADDITLSGIQSAAASIILDNTTGVGTRTITFPQPPDDEVVFFAVENLSGFSQTLTVGSGDTYSIQPYLDNGDEDPPGNGDPRYSVWLKRTPNGIYPVDRWPTPPP